MPRLKRYAVRRLGDEHGAEEVVQEALLRAFQHQHLFATEDDLMAWLTVVTGRLVIDRLRVRGRATPVAEMPANARPTRDTAEIVVARDEARVALDALESMPSRQASVLWAREVEGLSYDEIGDRFGLSEPSVRSTLHRARRTLRREYAARGGTLPAVGLVALAPWLHGMRTASRLRHLVRRGGAVAAATATGVVVATVLPFGIPQPPDAVAAAPSPHLRTKAVQVAMPHHRHHAKQARPAPVSPADHPAPAAVEPPSTKLVTSPQVCGGKFAGREVGANCETHHSPTVYVKLPVPVAGQRWVGVSTDQAACRAVPTTLLTQCDDPTEGTQP